MKLLASSEGSSPLQPISTLLLCGVIKCHLSKEFRHVQEKPSKYHSLNSTQHKKLSSTNPTCIYLKVAKFIILKHLAHLNICP